MASLKEILCGWNELVACVDQLKAQSVPAGRCEEQGIIAAYGFVGANGALFNGHNIASVTQIGVGQYQVVFATPMATAAYTVTFGNLNNLATRDGRFMEIINGTQTAAGFSYYTATGDNGGAADILVNQQVSFHVAETRILYICDEVTP